MSNHYVDQLIRFIRLFALAFLGTGIFNSSHITRDALISAGVAAAEVVFRQLVRTVPVAPPGA